MDGQIGPHDPRHVHFFEFVRMDMIWAENKDDYTLALRRGIQHADTLTEQQRKWLSEEAAKPWGKGRFKRDAQLQKEILWCLPYVGFLKPDETIYTPTEAVTAIEADNKKRNTNRGDTSARKWRRRVVNYLEKRANSVSRE